MRNFTSKSQKIGELGEDVACKYLEKQGFIILERNYTKKWGEIDIIARKDEKLYFIEVKAVSRNMQANSDVASSTIDGLVDRRVKSGGEFIDKFRPEENMHSRKLKRLSRTVGTYLIHNRIGNTPWQFDLLVVYLDMQKRLARVKVVDNVILS